MRERIKTALHPSRTVMGLLGIVALVGGVLIPATISGASGDHAAVDYAQCANKTDANTGCTKWINGILNANNSFYRENEVTPQRLTVTVTQATTGACTAGDTSGCHSITISYLARKGDHHAYDSLATWNHTQTTADRCDGLTPAVKSEIGCTGGAPSSDTHPITPDSTSVHPVGAGKSAVTSDHDLNGQVLQMFSRSGNVVDIVKMDPPVHTDAGTSTTSNFGDDYATTTIYYSTTSTGAVQLLFGGHLAPGPQSIGWGTGLGSSDINGGPYHIRWTANDALAVGSRDNQIMSGAIQPLAATVITTLVSLSDSATIVGFDGTGDGTGDVTFTLYGPEDQNCDGTADSDGLTAVAPRFTQTFNDVTSGNIGPTNAYQVPADDTITGAINEGNYRWVVAYTGDSRNDVSSSGCNSEVVNVNYTF